MARASYCRKNPQGKQWEHVRGLVTQSEGSRGEDLKGNYRGGTKEDRASGAHRFVRDQIKEIDIRDTSDMQIACVFARIYPFVQYSVASVRPRRRRPADSMTD